tara:strand:+ start:535 stop:723 length:189 start_codon:yes stop_codon:yes gene_type:complete
MKNNLKKIIRDKGIHQGWLAKQLGVSSTAISYWVNNRRQPSGVYIAYLTKILNCSAQEIYDV